MQDAIPVAHPTLYGPGADGVVRILGQRCRRCGHVAFPRQAYGCETCGAFGEELVAEDLEAAGTLVSFAQVHRHHGKDIEAPFMMAEVRLVSGPLLRCTLAQRDAAGLRSGAPMVGRLMAEADAPPELRFARAEVRA